MVLLTIAIAPGVFWLWYFLQRDRLRPEPRFLIQRVFMLGVASALVAGVLELAFFRAAGLQHQRPVLHGLVLAAVATGIIEEGMKFAGPAEGAWLLRGLALAAVAHAAYDAAVLSDTAWALAVIPIVMVLWRRAVVHVREALTLDNQRLGGSA